MSKFTGFTDGKIHLTPVPEPFFNELLPQIDDLGELKLTIYMFRMLDTMEGNFRYFEYDQLKEDTLLREILTNSGSSLNDALVRTIARGTILAAITPTDAGNTTCYFINSPKGRSAVEAIENGHWHPITSKEPDPDIDLPVPNIFRLYEENIGPLTPLIAETLGEVEDTYPIKWIEDSIRIAVENNKRSWRYVAAILERWQREGRDVRKEKPSNQQDPEETRRKYTEGEFSDFIEH